MRASFDVNENYYPFGILEGKSREDGLHPGYIVTDMVELEALHSTPLTQYEASRIAREANEKYRTQRLTVTSIRDFVAGEVAEIISQQGQ